MPRFWHTFLDRRNADPTKEQKARIADYRLVFSGDAGQRVLADICRRAGVMQTTWGDDGPFGTAYREGRRRTALEIIEVINSNPESVVDAVLTGTTEALFND